MAFKVFIEFVTVLFLFYVLFFWPRGMWDLSSPKGMERTPAALKAQSLNYWEVPTLLSFSSFPSFFSFLFIPLSFLPPFLFSSFLWT